MGKKGQTRRRKRFVERWCLTKSETKLTTPESTPPAPKPAMLLPKMKAIEFGAAPQRADPASKSKIDVKKVALMLKIL